MRRTVISIVATALGATALLVPVAPAVAAPEHTQIPSEVPASATPAFGSGRVNAITQVGSTMVVGGTFEDVTPPGGAQRNATGIAAFNATTGQLVSGFSTTLNGAVEEVLPGPDPGTVYVSGSFTQVNGAAQSHVTLLDVTTGQVVAGFRPAATNGGIDTITVAQGRLLIGGSFTTAGGQAHAGLASLHPRTGALDGLMGVDVTGHHNDSGSGAQGAVGVRDMEATSDGSKLAVIGNFTQADGLERDQAMVIDLTASSATVDADWRTLRYEPYCFKNAFDSYMRGLAVSPDDSYFVISTTGGGNPGTLCDAIARFDFDQTGNAIQPVWSSAAGGDTLWGVEVTENAVYVGGHQRWMNNSDGRDSNGQGSVPRPGISAHDPDSGVPLSWNPGRNPRGVAAYALFATPAGLWVGSNTIWVGNRQYRRERLAFFPLAGGAAPHPETTPALPGDVYLADPAQSQDALSAVGFDGTTPQPPTASDPRGIAWQNVRGGFVVGDTLFTAETDGYFHRRTFTEDETGPDERIDPYNDPFWSDVDTGSDNTFRGRVPNLYGQIGTLTGLTYDSDRIYYTRTGDSQLYWRWFNADSGIIGSETFTANGGRNWSDTGGLFVDGSDLYVVSRSTGTLSAVPFDDGPQGPAVLVDTTVDWRAAALFIGPQADPVPPNEPPTAAFTVTCDALTCDVDGTSSSDPEDDLTSYAWTFGDGVTATTPTATHTYAADDTYTIRLEVTDGAGLTDATTQQVTVAADTTPPGDDIAFATSASTAGNNNNPALQLPAAIDPGDQLVLVGSYQGTAFPTNPAGWSRVDDETTTGMNSVVWTRTATANDAGTTVTTPLPARLKFSLTLTAHTGVDPTTPIAAIASATDTDTTQHPSPTLQAPAGARIIQAWTDKSSTTDTWTAPPGTTVRETAYGPGSGRISALLTDHGPVTAGTAGGQTATTNAPSGKAINWTIALRPGSSSPPVDEPPTAAFTVTCDALTCDVDGTSSSDPEDDLTSYAWTFGDGVTATTPTATHTYAADDTYTIRLEVTDGAGLTDATTQQVTVAADTTPPGDDIAFATSASTAGNNNNPALQLPAAIDPGDQLVLVGSYQGTAFPTNPAGWSRVDDETTTGMNSVVWTRTATANDAGTTVTTPLPARLKFSLTLTAHTGVDPTTPIAAIASATDTDTTQHPSPTLQAPAGARIIQAWTDKSSTTDTWTAPPGTTVRETAYGPGSGRISALLTDHGPVTAGTAGGQTATTNAPSGKAITWTIALRPGS